MCRALSTSDLWFGEMTNICRTWFLRMFQNIWRKWNSCRWKMIFWNAIKWRHDSTTSTSWSPNLDAVKSWTRDKFSGNRTLRQAGELFSRRNNEIVILGILMNESAKLICRRAKERLFNTLRFRKLFFNELRRDSIWVWWICFSIQMVHYD